MAAFRSCARRRARRIVAESRRIASWTDPLTGTWNRRWLSNVRLRAGRTGTGPGIALLIDVDGLGRVNDRFGYGEGDRTLVGVARVLGSLPGIRGRLVRLGGDEFLVPLAVVAPEEARRVAETAVAAVAARIGCGGAPIRISAGIAAVRAAARPDWDRLIEAAYRALKAAKHAGGGRVRWTWA